MRSYETLASFGTPYSGAWLIRMGWPRFSIQKLLLANLINFGLVVSHYSPCARSKTNRLGSRRRRGP